MFIHNFSHSASFQKRYVIKRNLKLRKSKHFKRKSRIKSSGVTVERTNCHHCFCVFLKTCIDGVTSWATWGAWYAWHLSWSCQIVTIFFKGLYGHKPLKKEIYTWMIQTLCSKRKIKTTHLRNHRMNRMNPESRVSQNRMLLLSPENKIAIQNLFSWCSS